MSRSFARLTFVAMLGLAAAANSADAASLSAKLTGYEIVPPVHSLATGDFTGNAAAASMSFSMSYGGFGSDVRQVQIHFGQAGVKGGVVLLLCSNDGGPTGVP